MKFCGQCGNPLSRLCSNCNYSNPSQFRFCGNCGTSLESHQPDSSNSEIQKYIPTYLAEKIRQSKGRIEGERKNVTVIFADISGFTALAEICDPEEAASIINACHAVLGKLVYKYEGIVDKIIGDGLMAIFGIPVHEDDPERAILAAIEMQQEMGDLTQEFEKSMGINLGLSIGINTGMVVVGDIGTDLRLDYTIIGDVVNTAFRMQENAKSGEILVTQETYNRASHCFDFEILDTIRVRGKSQPLSVYKLVCQKEKSLKTRGIDGLNSPLIGRDIEFNKCKKTVERLVADKGGTLLITGDAGLGKSRLVAELRKYARSSDSLWLEGKCVSYSRSINYWVFIDAFRDYFGAKGDADIAEIGRIIRKNDFMDGIEDSAISTIASLLSAKSKNGRISDDLDETEKKRRIFIAVKDVLSAISQSKPLVLVLEDLHWADELSMELLLFLEDELRDSRIAFVCAYRPEIGDMDSWPVQSLEKECWYGRSAASDRTSRIVLNPLSNTDSNMLLSSLLAEENLPIEFKGLILDKAGGNPLYLEEVIRAIIDDRAIEQRNGRWLAMKNVEDIDVPSTIQGVIMARIDKLEEFPKHILQCAAVIGRSFEYAVLLYMLNEHVALDSLHDEGDAIQECLIELEKMGFISHEDDDSDFRFRHVLIQEVAYSTILKRRRRELHEVICHYIEKANRDCLSDFYEILAYHYSHSNNTESALSYLIKAGNKNMKAYAGSAENALRNFHKALGILDGIDLPDDRGGIFRQDIYYGIGEVYKDLGHNDRALSSFETLLHVAEQREDRAMKANALRQIGNNKSQSGDWEAAQEAYMESLFIAQELDDLPKMGFAYTGLGYGYFDRGELDEAMKNFKRALEIGKRCGELLLIGDASDGLGTIASIRHDFDGAIKYYQVSLGSYKKAQESHYEAQIYHNLGITHFKKEELAIADKYYEETLGISEKCDYIRLTAYTYLNRVELFLRKSDLDRARDFCIKAFQMLRTLEDKWAIAEGYKFYGMIHRCQKNYKSAREAFETSLQVSAECEHMSNVAEVYCEMGLMCAKEGMQKEALDCLEKSRLGFKELDIIEELQKVEKFMDEIRQEKVLVYGR